MSTALLTVRLTIFILVGVLAVKARIVSTDFSKQLASLMLTICLPCLIVRSFYTTEMNEGTMSVFGFVFASTAVTFAVLFLAGYIAKRLTRSRTEGKVALYGMLTCNFTFFGMPLVETLFGPEGLFYYTILTTFARVVYYALPPYMLGENCRGSVREVASQLTTPIMLAVVVGLAMYFTHTKLPPLLDEAAQSLASTSTPLGMMLCGMTLAQANARESFSRPSAYIMTVARLVICPGLVLLACLACGFEPLIIKIAVIYSAMPFGAMLPTFATKYCADEKGAVLGSTLVFISTVFCIFTIPMWVFIFDKIL